MKINVLKNNCSGASLLEVMIAMVILTVGFLGVMALSIALTNNNATAGKINTATTIAQAEVSQLNCLGVSGIQQYFPQISPWTYTYIVTPTIINPNTQKDTRNQVSQCLNPALTAGSAIAPINLGVTLPYTVTVNLAYNSTSPSLIDAEVQVSWYDAYNAGNVGNIGEHMIILYNTIG
ncbi:MAG: type IV pilus modification PilV family protein [bacterium]